MGARFIFGNPQLKALAVTGMLANFVLLPFLGLMLPVLATRVFGSPALLGICLSAFGLSASLGAFSFSRLNRLYSRSLIFYGGLSISAAAIFLCGVFTTFTSVIVLSAIAGLLLGAGNPLEQTILQEETPKMWMGQVFTALSALRFAGGPFGLLLAGFAIEFGGVRVVLVLAGGLLLLGALLGWVFAPLREKKLAS